MARRLKIRIIPLEGYGSDPFRLTVRALQVVVRIIGYDTTVATVDGSLLFNTWSLFGVYTWLELRPQNDTDGTPLEYAIDWRFNGVTGPIFGSVTIVYLEDH